MRAAVAILVRARLCDVLQDVQHAVTSRLVEGARMCHWKRAASQQSATSTEPLVLATDSAWMDSNQLGYVFSPLASMTV